MKSKNGTPKNSHSQPSPNPPTLKYIMEKLEIGLIRQRETEKRWKEEERKNTALSTIFRDLQSQIYTSPQRTEQKSPSAPNYEPQSQVETSVQQPENRNQYAVDNDGGPEKQIEGQRQFTFKK